MAKDVHYKLMRLLEAQPGISQRRIAKELKISLGKTNYCLKQLAKKGWIKATNFTNSQNKAGYMYLLTPRGVRSKAALAVQFLQIKMHEYEVLRIEIEQMQRDAVNAQSGTRASLGDVEVTSLGAEDGGNVAD